jgi:hypothetical protein
MTAYQALPRSIREGHSSKKLVISLTALQQFLLAAPLANILLAARAMKVKASSRATLQTLLTLP